MKISKLLTSSMIASMAFFAGLNRSEAALLELTHDPLFLSQSVPPAIAVTFDDSGSMERGYVIGVADNTSGRFADPLENRIYYNPNIVYSPPIGPDGVQFPDADPTAARVDGFGEAIGAVNITTNYVPLFIIDYERDEDVRIQFARGGHPGLASVRRFSAWTNQYPTPAAISFTGTPNNGVPAFYTERQTDGSYNIINVPADQHVNFANWYSYYNTRMKLGRTAVSRAFATFGPSFKIAWQQLNANTVFPALDRFETAHREAFFDDWLFKVPTEGGTPLRNAFNRAGEMFEQDSSYTTDLSNDLLSCQQNFHIALSDGAWNGGFADTTITFDETGQSPRLPGDSTAPPGPGDLGQEYGAYTGTGFQRIHSSNDNLRTLSDIAFHYWSRDLKGGLDNNVKRFQKDYIASDGSTITVPMGQDEWDVPEFVWNPRNDAAYWQHMVNYNIGLGLDSSLVEAYLDGDFSVCPEQTGITDPREAVLRALRNGDCAWPSIPDDQQFTEFVAKVDDVWRSSLNSRGDFFSATDPQELVAALNSVINNILERLSQGGSSSVSSGVVTAGALAFTPGFDSSNWSGSFIARTVEDTSGFGDPLWDLSCELTGGACDSTGIPVPKQTNRNIFVYDKATDTLQSFDASLGGTVGATFNANSLDLRTDLNISLNELIDYIKGDQSNEVAGGTGLLRDRETVLADIVHSSPVVIRGPGESYTDNLWPATSATNNYLQFRLDNQNRENVAYIGSNGGMLHAVRADGADRGEELWGYIPSKAIENLHTLANPIYTHTSFVDNTPVLTDAFFNNQWNSVLIGGMRFGGQAYYAVNVTNTITNQPDVMWEFTDADDADMGFSYGEATIVRVTSTDEWVALIPNGYNNSQNDFDDPSDPRNIIGDGSAALYVVRLSDGQLLAKLDTNVGSTITPNGMGPAVAVDSRLAPGGVDIGADFAYAGDLYGNLWRFDFTSSDYSDWESSTSITRIVEADVIKDRPITQKPRVVENPLDTGGRDVVVMYVTGKYIELPDRSINIADQYIAGVFDGLAADPSTYPLSILDSTLVEQTLTNSGDFRDVTDNDVDLANLNVDGWKIRLPDQGERGNTPLITLGSQILLVATTIPSGEDPCDSGGTGWVMALNPFTGGTPGVGGIFEQITVTGVDADGNPITTIEGGIGQKIYDPATGSINILESPDGDGSLIIEGSSSTTVIDISKFTWRRRNFTNLLTE